MRIHGNRLLIANLSLFALEVALVAFLLARAEDTEKTPALERGGVATGPLALAALPFELPRRFVGDAFALATDAELPLEPLSIVAEDARRRLRGWLELPERATTREPTAIYLCRRIDTIYEIERRYGLAVSKEPWRTFPFRGGCYVDRANFIAIPAESFAAMRWAIAHEVAHTVLAEAAPSRSCAIDEGFAELVSNWLLGPESIARPEDARARHYRYEERLRRAVEEQAVPRLRDLVELGYWSFHEQKLEQTHFALSWSLAKLLVESVDPRIEGRYRRLLTRIADGERASSALAAVYDLAHVERAWRESMLQPIAWEPRSGSWETGADALVATASAGASARIVARDAPPVDAGGWTLGFWTPDVVDPAAEFGFVLGWRSDEHVDALLRAGGRAFAIVERDADGAERRTEHALPLDLVLVGRSVVLRCDRAGSLALVVDGLIAAEHELGPRAHAGAIGFALAAPDAGGSAVTMRFGWPSLGR